MRQIKKDLFYASLFTLGFYIIVILTLLSINILTNSSSLLNHCYTFNYITKDSYFYEVQKVVKEQDGLVMRTYTYPGNKEFQGRWYVVQGDDPFALTTDTRELFLKYYTEVKCPY